MTCSRRSSSSRTILGSLSSQEGGRRTEADEEVQEYWPFLLLVVCRWCAGYPYAPRLQDLPVDQILLSSEEDSDRSADAIVCRKQAPAPRIVVDGQLQFQSRQGTKKSASRRRATGVGREPSPDIAVRRSKAKPMAPPEDSAKGTAQSS